MLYLCAYFLAIYLTIATYIFLPKKAHRFATMMGIHLTMTVPAAYFVAKELTSSKKLSDDFYLIAFATILLTVVSLSLSGVVVKRIK